MADNANTGNAGVESADEKKRFRGELSFPYSDLESAVELAQTLHSTAGTSCEQDELAAWMNQSATGGNVSFPAIDYAEPTPLLRGRHRP